MLKQHLKMCEAQYPLPELSWDEADSAIIIRNYLTETQERLNQMLKVKVPSRDIITWRTATIDKLLIGIFNQTSEILSGDKSNQHPYAILAQGGYGRVELCYHSDIDLLFLHNETDPDKLKLRIEHILYPLWDSGLDLGFAVRTEKDCLRLIKDDLTILTSLMDARLLAGNRDQYNHFFKSFWDKFKNPRFLNTFIEKKETEQIERRHKYGDSVFLQEPNIKEGEGGLRDYHHIHWALMGFFGTDDLSILVDQSWINSEELQNLKSAVEFIWTIRNALHYRTGRKTDRIHFEYQRPLADWLGFKDTEEILAVEDFMRTYYRHAAECFRISEVISRKLEEAISRSRRLKTKQYRKRDIDEYFQIENNLITLKDPNSFRKFPHNLLRIFRLMQETGASLSHIVKKEIRDNMDLIDTSFQCDPKNTHVFRKMLAEPEIFVPPVMMMHEIGVLERFLPEFAKLMYRAQNDIYHVYTVDIHSILAVGEYGKLVSGDYEKIYPTPTEVVRSVPKLDLLSFAILYHDVGKGEGAGHIAKGAPLIRLAAERLGFSPSEVDQLEFLELSHLIMTHLAFRRDLDDPNLIIEFAEKTKTEENLCLLYLLTFSDLKAVSPKALNKWKESLLEYLFIRARSVLIKRDFSTERIEEIASKLLDNVKLLAGDQYSHKEIAEFFDVMPPRYFLTTSAPRIIDHLNMMQRFKGSPFVFQRRDINKEDLNEWTLLTLESPGLFPSICGVLAANGISISEAYLNTTTDGKSLHIFKVHTAQGTMIKIPEKWDKVEQNIKDVLQGKVSLQKLLGDRLKPSIFKRKTVRRFPTKIVVHNDLSPFYTIIDIYAHDRVGLLYHITSALTALGLYVGLSKIATKVDQVTDTFYVQDIFGQKIRSETRIENIRKILLSVIDGSY